MDTKYIKVEKTSDMILSVTKDACLCLAVESIVNHKQFVIILDDKQILKLKKFLGDYDE